MKKYYYLFLLILLYIGGCGEKIVRVNADARYIYIGVDPKSGQLCAAAVTPGINGMYERTTELTVQNEWLRKNLNKCLQKLEAERGLNPIQLESKYFPAAEPNVIDRSPWFMPYEAPRPKRLYESSDNLSMLCAMMNMHSSSMAFYTWGTEKWIKNFEERMKRIDPNL